MRLIDADKLNMYFADVQLVNRGWKDEFCDALDDIMDAVDEQPTIDPESLRPKGRWIHDYNNRYGCSRCGERETMSPKKLKHFCFNCGAKM